MRGFHRGPRRSRHLPQHRVAPAPVIENLAASNATLTISTAGSSLTTLGMPMPNTRRDLPHPRLFFGRRHGRRHP
jgi:hypothetical protein